MAEVRSQMLDVGTIYHNLLFSYQRSLKNYLGSRSGGYISPTLEHLLSTEEQGGLKIGNSETFEEALMNFTDFLVKGKIVKACNFEKIDEEKYIFKVEGCIWAGKVHKQVNTEDVTCPYAMVAMALYRKFKGIMAEENGSEYHGNGTETILEPAVT